MTDNGDVSGSVAHGFEPVRDVFAEIVDEHSATENGTGAAVAAWSAGSWVVDLWGGWADVRRTRPWSRDSIAMPYSVTKPFAAVCALLLVDRGRIDLDAPVSRYWPELRAAVTVRQLLSHQAGLVVLDEDVPTETFYNHALLCRLLEKQEPSWEPGTAHGESALFYGHLISEVVRRVDGRSLGSFLREEICGPLDLDFHVGLADEELTRVVDLTGYDEDFYRRGAENPSQLFLRALNNPPGALDPDVVNSRAWRTAEIGAVNGHGTARAIAGLYVALHEGRLLSPNLLREATTVAASGLDLVLGTENTWGLGVGVDSDGYGMGGIGGSFGWWSEAGQYAFGFVTGLIGDHDRGDRLENALRACLGLPPV